VERPSLLHERVPREPSADGAAPSEGPWRPTLVRAEPPRYAPQPGERIGDEPVGDAPPSGAPVGGEPGRHEPISNEPLGSEPLCNEPLSNEPVWTAESPPARSGEPLGRDLNVDVAIVGAGLTGISVALHMRERFPELGIVVLEASTLSSQASGRNAGQMLHGFAWDPASDDRMARRIYEVTEMGIQIAEAWSAGVAPLAFRRTGCLALQTSVRHAETAASEVEHSCSLGIPMRFVPRSELRFHGVEGGVLDPHAGILNARALLYGLQPRLAEAEIRVYERTPVIRIAPGEIHTLETPGGKVRARTLVLATNAHTPALGFFRRGLLSLHAHVLATPVLPQALWDELGWTDFSGISDDRTRLSYATRTPEGRLIFGGGSNAAYSYAHPDDVARERRARGRAHEPLRRVLTQYMPALRDVPTSHLWSGRLCIPLDRICSMGQGGRHQNVYHALGYSGHGLALSLLAGKVITDLYSGDHAAWRDVPFYQRRFRSWPPEPLRWMAYETLTRIADHVPFWRG